MFNRDVLSAAFFKRDVLSAMFRGIFNRGIYLPQSKEVDAEFRGVFLVFGSLATCGGGSLGAIKIVLCVRLFVQVLDFRKILLVHDLRSPQVADSTELKNSAKLRVNSFTLR